MHFRRHGYLFLIPDPATLRVFEKNAELQRSPGVDMTMLDPRQAADLFPGIRTDDLLGATYSADDGSGSPPAGRPAPRRRLAGRGAGASRTRPCRARRPGQRRDSLTRGTRCRSGNAGGGGGRPCRRCCSTRRRRRGRCRGWR
ncbi:FAD-dependent oxidoreductase [Streptomyces sp. NPDC021212]|uniref:FAD-dependent oxidoreductase n=1 Tax=Streptomyces sp. NPDC021212 TaxID=3365118 RepID=UPI0037A84CF6